MKNLPQIFNYHGIQVRTVNINNDPWFVLKDLCDVLDLSNHRMVKDRLSDDVSSTYSIPDALGRPQDTTIINEDGLYDVILESRKPEAKAFRKWVTSEVLPSIRKTGSYSMAPQLPQTYKEALVALLSKVEENEHLQLKIETDKPLVLFAESLQVSQDSILIGELAKVLKQNGIEIGQNRLFKTLREEGYLIKSGEQYNMPTQRSMDMRLFEIKVGSRNSSDGTIKITRTPKVTGKGQIYFVNRFKGKPA